MFSIGMNNRLNQPVANDIGFVEKLKAIPSTLLKASTASISPLRLFRGRSIWVRSPVTTHFES